MTRSPNRILKRVSLCSSLAIATSLVVGPSPAAAQSFQGSGSFTTNNGGSANISIGTDTTFINVNSGQTVIDWSPTPDGGASGTAINFQPAGTTATFNGTGNYAVLNRIGVTDSSRIVGLNGRIESFVGGELRGGSIYFYSPSGFVLGAGAVIDVGSLVLSASPIAVDPETGDFINGTTVKFNQAANPAAQIFTNPGSLINAPVQGSYVAMVAPRVEHHGNINVNGAAALVGAEAATINFRAGGLFDIQIDTGTTDPNGVEIGGTGSITGPATTGFPDYHRAYLVAVPKNTALTMLIRSGSELGFEIAGAADVVGNAVVLSAGYDVEFGSTGFAPSLASGADANIDQVNSNLTSALYGRANGYVAAGSAAGGTSTFASDVSLRARDSVSFVAGNPESIVTVGGNLTLSANADGLNEGESATAGAVELDAFNGGSLSVAGNTNLSAVGVGGFGATAGLASGDGTGGTILVQSTTGGDLSLGGALSADASGRGGSIGNTGVDGGSGFGGAVNVFTSATSSMSVAGGISLTANGRAGSTVECFSCGAAGGIGDAGTVKVQAHTGPNNTMDFGGDLIINANGQGGDGPAGDAGAGFGGDVTVSSSDQSSMTVADDVSISAYGHGGNAFGASGDGGDGFGGNTTVAANTGGSLDMASSFYAYMNGNGGSSEAGNGGYGEGGFGQLYANASTAAVGLYSQIDATGYGGDGLASGGDGQGGRAYFIGNNGGTLTLGSYAGLSAGGNGGDAYDADGLGGNGGLGKGGHVEAYANNATLDAQDSLNLSADGEGGRAGGLRDAGDSQGGEVYLQAISGGSLTIANQLFASAVGVGDEIDSTTFSGDGTGGFIGIYSREGDSTLTVSGEANLYAYGAANAEGECFPCGGIGGVGHGGNIVVASQGATGVNGNLLDFQDELFATVNGYGGDGVGGVGGDGIGGTVSLSAGGANTVQVAGPVSLEAIGWGGYNENGGTAGNGTGGNASIVGDTNGSLDLNGSASVDATGYGGDVGNLTGGTGGNGTGGVAQFLINNAGTIDVAADVFAEAEGYGGDTFGGTGGNGTGGTAQIFLTGGTTTIAGSVQLDVSGFGGDGLQGGDGIGGGIPDPDAPVAGAYIFARNATITISGTAELTSAGVGGDGSDSVGGNGGNGKGGWAAIQARNADAGPSSISAAMVILDADGTGGDGGTGSSGNAGGDGGNGGTGTGGSAGTSAAAGNGMVTFNSVLAPELYNVTATAIGTGGRGGDGGNGDGLPGGSGGDGGTGIGGDVQIGTISGNLQALALHDGVGNYGTVLTDASAFGGNGGDGNFGSVQGNGGNGGGAFGGGTTLLVRGSTVNVRSATLFANATGGNGGAGPVQGAGGDATIGTNLGYNFTGGVAVAVTKRFELPQRGQLNAGQITGTAIATGGFGQTNGLSQSLGGSQFVVSDSDATIGSLSFNVDADSYAPAAVADRITITNGTVEVTGGFDDAEAFYPGDFTFATSGDLSLFADTGLFGGSMTVDNILTLTAGNFVPDVNGEPPLNAGTYFANLINITSGLNIYTTANLDSGSDFTLVAPGFISAANIDASGSIDLWAQGGAITTFDLSAGGDVDLLAATSITTGAIDGGASMTIHALGGLVTIGDLTAVYNVDIEATDSITAGEIDTGSIYANAANGGITVGNIAADGDIVLTALNGAITGGDFVNAAGWMIVNGASIQTGDLTAGGLLSLQASGAIDVGNASSATYIQVTAGGNMTLGNLVAGLNPDGDDAVHLEAGGSILLGNITSAGGIDFDAAGSVTGLNITTGSELGGGADGAVSLGNISAGLVNPQGPVADGFSVELSSGTSISVGSVAGAEGIAFATPGALTTGDINAGTDFLALASGNMSLGSITATGRTYLADYSMFALSQTGEDFDPAPIFAATPVASTGSITILGPVSTGSFQAAGAAIAVGNINANSFIEMMSSGSISFDALVAGTFVTIDPTDIVGGDVTALAGDVNLTGDSIDIGNVSASDNVFLTTLAGDLSTGTIDAGFDVTLDASGDVFTSDITAGGLIDATGASLALGNLSANSISLTTTVANLTVGNVTILGTLALNTAGDLTFDNLNAFDVNLSATGAISGHDIDSATDITALAGTNMSLGTLDAGGFFVETFLIGNISLTAGGNITTLAQSAFGDVLMNADADISTGDITGASITAFAGGDIGTGDLITQELLQFFVPGVSVWLDSGGDITTGDISSFDSVHAQAVGGIATGAIDAAGFVELFGGGGISTADILAGDYIDIFTSGGTIALGDLDAGNQIELGATGAISFGNAIATDFDFDGGGSVTGGNIVASQIAGGQAQGAITLQNISAGSDVEFIADDGFSVGMASETSITVGDVTGAHAVGFATLGPLVTGDIDAGEGFMALVTGNMNLGAITTDPAGQVYLADGSMFLAAGGPDDFDPSLVLGASPVATHGSITIGGPVSTSLFQAAAGTGLSAGGINAQTIEASAGGTATVNGNWSANEITLTSNDIDIGANGFLDTGLTGPLTLISTNGTQALIGDGLTGTGYALSNAEFGRLHGGAVSILTNGSASAAQDMLIGDLSITGPLAGSTIDNPNGIVLFATGDPSEQVPGGVIRVVGDIAATGFQSGNALEFQTGVFELDAATGSISLTGSSNALAGILDITADRIHVASAAILDKLADDPHYAGYQAELNAPAAVQRPDGVIRASQIFVQPTEAVLVQNTGTSEIPAGFIAEFAELTASEGAPNGSIELIVNGQLVTEGGTLTGIEARDAYVADTDLSIYSANSTFNGCPLTGDCVIVPPQPEQPPIDPVGGISTEITLISDDVLAEQPFGNEPAIDEDESGDSGKDVDNSMAVDGEPLTHDDESEAEDDETSSPIEAPAPLFDTRPLNPDADVDEPISGSGNPALTGAGPVNDGDEQ